ncbi:MAG: S8 family serine peptidase [Pseudomonadota bacterium]
MALGLMLLAPGLGAAADRFEIRGAGTIPNSVTTNKLDSPLLIQSVDSVDSVFAARANERIKVIVRLKGDPVTRHFDQSTAGQQARKEALKARQSAFMARADQLAPGNKELASTQVVLNSVFLDVKASQIDALREDPEVFSVHRVGNYELELSETVPYIGAAAVQDAGLDGSGVTVAVLDSGIDYLHADLGGSGDPVEYAANDRDIIEPGTFPTAKVVGGFDFVGETWPSGPEGRDGPLSPDPDPLDFEGHGTHVADIIAGAKGVAPGVDLYAVKVCSAVDSACSGIALIQGMEFIVDPNGDGDTSDHVDINNMSLGSLYGQAFDDDLAAAVDNATAVGVLTVASAGNSSDKPYANGTPASASTALSVAQTQVPSAELPFVNVEGTDYPAVFQPWSTAPDGITDGSLQYGDGAGGNLNGCAPFAPGSLTGLVVLIDRGACNFTLKIKNVQDAGAVIGIIGLIAPGDPFSGGDGGDGPITIPGYMVSQADSNAMMAQVGSLASVDPSGGLPLIGTMVGSSSRGPQHEVDTLIKPEIGAPGASVSAIAGSGVGTGPFGGTSGAAPMASGVAALLLESEPMLSPLEAKARLINNGETNIDTDSFTGLAPITRIGGGEVRADWAITATTAAWDGANGNGTLSFGFIDVVGTAKLRKELIIANYANEKRDYNVEIVYRYADDEASGAVTFKQPNPVTVGATKPGKEPKTRKVSIEMEIHGDLLGGNTMNSGIAGADPDSLTAQEFDGYVIVSSGESSVHVPWHVLPRKAADVYVTGNRKKFHGKGQGGEAEKGGKPNGELKFEDGLALIALDNRGVGTAQIDAYSVIAVSGDLPEGELGQQSPTPDIRAVGVNTVPVGPNFCLSEPSFVWEFAITTWERQQHLLPVSHQVGLDIDRDGEVDYVILNRDFSGPDTISDGRQLAWVLDVEAETLGAFFFAEHSTNTGNTVLRVCAEQVGLTGADLFTTNVDVSVLAQDVYFGGPGDELGPVTITPFAEQYFALPEDIPGGESTEILTFDLGLFPGNTPEFGVLMITNGDRGAANHGGATEESEALLFSVK